MTGHEYDVWNQAYVAAYLLRWLDVVNITGRPHGESYEQWASDQADAVLESWRVASRAKDKQR
jgi:hypothetical protein